MQAAVGSSRISRPACCQQQSHCRQPISHDIFKVVSEQKSAAAADKVTTCSYPISRAGTAAQQAELELEWIGLFNNHGDQNDPVTNSLIRPADMCMQLMPAVTHATNS